MMIFRYSTLLMLLLGSFFVYVGCDSTQREVIDAMRVDDPKLEMPGTPVSLVAFVNAPEGGEDAYLQWAASVLYIAEKLQEMRCSPNLQSFITATTWRIWKSFDIIPMNNPDRPSRSFVVQLSYNLS